MNNYHEVLVTLRIKESQYIPIFISNTPTNKHKNNISPTLLAVTHHLKVYQHVDVFKQRDTFLRWELKYVPCSLVCQVNLTSYIANMT